MERDFSPGWGGQRFISQRKGVVGPVFGAGGLIGPGFFFLNPGKFGLGIWGFSGESLRFSPGRDFSRVGLIGGTPFGWPGKGLPGWVIFPARGLLPWFLSSSFGMDPREQLGLILVVILPRGPGDLVLFQKNPGV